MIRLTVYVEDIATILAGGYTHLRVYMATSAVGAYGHQTDLLTTLVAGTTTYSIVDVDGLTAYRYKVAYYGATPGESEFSAILTPDVDTYCSLDDVKEYLAGEAWAQAGIRDGLIVELCKRVTTAFETHLGRTLFNSAAIAETHRARVRQDGRFHIYPAVRPVNSVSAFSYKGVPTDTATALVVADTVLIDGDEVLVYTGLSPTVGRRELICSITYDGGYVAIPDDIRQAAVRTVAYWLKQRSSNAFDVSVDMATGVRVIPALLPADVREALRGYA